MVEIGGKPILWHIMKWRPKYNIGNGLKATIEWHKNNAI